MFKNKGEYIGKLIIFLMIILTSNIHNFAQNKIDSLNIVLERHISEQGNNKRTAEILTELYEISSEINPLASMQYVANAIEIYTQTGDMIGVAKMQRNLGDSYFRQKMYQPSIASYNRSFEIFDSLKSEKEKAYTLLKIGNTYLKQRIDSKAGEAFENARLIFEKIKEKRGLSFVYNNIATIKINEYSNNEALALLDSSLQIRKNLKDNILIADSYEKIADVNAQLEEYKNANKYYNDALLLYKKSKKKIKEANIYYKKGEIYLLNQQYEKARISFQFAAEIYERNKLNNRIAKTQNKLGLTALKNSNSQRAKKFVERALYMSRVYNYSEIRKESYRLMANIYSEKGSFEAALEYMSLYAALSDTIFTKEQDKQTVDFQIGLATKEEKQKTKEEKQKNEILEKNQQLQKIKIEKQNADEKLLYLGLSLLVVVLIFAVVFGYYFYKINKKTKKANRLLIEKNEEINQQKKEISAQKDRLQDANAAITIQKNEIELKNKRITASMNYASRIQRAMSPKMKEVREKLPESFIMLSPKEAVSGDFFWYAVANDEQGNEKILITAIDCTGHGVPGAFMSMIGDAFLTQIVYQQNITSPEVILHKLHDGIATTLNQGRTLNTDGMDLAVCVIDKKNKILEFAGAKNPFVYIQNEEMKMIKGDNLAIGGIIRGRKRNYKKHKIDISIPTQFYIYSDGFQDQFGGKSNKKFMARRFRNLLFDIHKQDITSQAVSLAVVLEEWKGEKEQMDDILVVGVKLDLDKEQKKLKIIT